MPAGSEQQTIDMGASMETEAGLTIIDALNDVSDVRAMAGRKVTFVGTQVSALGRVGSLQGIDVYSCPRGWFVLFRAAGGPHWCVSGSDLSEALAAVGDGDLRGALQVRLRQEGLLE